MPSEDRNSLMSELAVDCGLKPHKITRIFILCQIAEKIGLERVKKDSFASLRDAFRAEMASDGLIQTSLPALAMYSLVNKEGDITEKGIDMVKKYASRMLGEGLPKGPGQE